MTDVDEFMDFERQVLDHRQVELVQDWLLEQYTGKQAKERSILVTAMIHYWALFEVRLLTFSRKISTRQAFLVMQEIVIEEMRTTFNDANNRRKFTPDGETIGESRDMYEDTVIPDEVLRAREVDETREKIERSAARLRSGVEHDLVEVE